MNNNNSQLRLQIQPQFTQNAGYLQVPNAALAVPSIPYSDVVSYLQAQMQRAISTINHQTETIAQLRQTVQENSELFVIMDAELAKTRAGLITANEELAKMRKQEIKNRARRAKELVLKRCTQPKSASVLEHTISTTRAKCSKIIRDYSALMSTHLDLRAKNSELIANQQALQDDVKAIQQSRDDVLTELKYNQMENSAMIVVMREKIDKNAVQIARGEESISKLSEYVKVTAEKTTNFVRELIGHAADSPPVSSLISAPIETFMAVMEPTMAAGLATIAAAT